VSLSDFQNRRPLPFVSATEPMDTEDWLRDTERKLHAVSYNDEEKLRYTSYMLIGPAACWWETMLTMKPPRVRNHLGRIQRKILQHSCSR
jgi:hypothetical protein